MQVLGCQFVGIGPGTLGVLLAADRLGLLSRLLDRGVALLDRLPDGRLLGASGLAYGISSNSRGGEMIAGIAADGRFARVLRTGWGERMLARRAEEIPLLHAARFFNTVAACACDLVRAHPDGRVIANREVATISIQAKGGFRTLDTLGNTIAISRSIVLSPGGCQDRNRQNPVAPGLASGRTVILSDPLLRAGGGDAVRRLRGGTAGRVAVIGGSHSAFSVALTLLRRAGRHLGPGDVRIVHRAPIRHYYGSLAEARRLRVGREPLELCPDTGIVNRFSGLRGDAAALSRLVHRGGEPRVWLIDAVQHPAGAEDAFGGADLVVDATGYAAAPLRFVGPDGQVIALGRQQGFAADERNRLLRPGGTPFDGIYVTGLARRYASAAKPALAAIGAGVGVYQQIDGVTIAIELAGGAAAAQRPRRS